MNKIVIGLVLFVMGLAVAPAAFAAPESGADFTFRHPARTQVIYRVERIKWMVDGRERNGDFSPSQARALKAEADGIGAEEAFFASQHGGRISVFEQKKLNWELNQLVQQIDA